MTPPLPSAQAVKDASVTRATAIVESVLDAFGITKSGSDSSVPAHEFDEMKEYIIRSVAHGLALPIAPDDRDEKLRKAVEALKEMRSEHYEQANESGPTDSRGHNDRDCARHLIKQIDVILTELTGGQKP